MSRRRDYDALNMGILLIASFIDRATGLTEEVQLTRVPKRLQILYVL